MFREDLALKHSHIDGIKFWGLGKTLRGSVSTWWAEWGNMPDWFCKVITGWGLLLGKWTPPQHPRWHSSGREDPCLEDSETEKDATMKAMQDSTQCLLLAVHLRWTWAAPSCPFSREQLWADRSYWSGCWAAYDQWPAETGTPFLQESQHVVQFML